MERCNGTDVKLTENYVSGAKLTVSGFLKWLHRVLSTVRKKSYTGRTVNDIVHDHFTLYII